jgi:acyl carrier protein
MDDLEQRLRGIVAGHFGIKPDFDLDTPLAEFGADSLDMLELGMELDEILGAPIPEEDEFRVLHSVRTILNYVKNTDHGRSRPSG